MMKQTMQAAALVVGLLSVSACGASGKGLDRVLDMRDFRTLGESCGKAYAEMRAANTKEFVELKDLGQLVFDLSQPRDAAQFQLTAGQLCNAWAKEAFSAAQKSNVELGTIREIWVWSSKASIDEDVAHYERRTEQYRSKTGPCDPQRISPYQYEGMCTKPLRDAVERIRENQHIVQALTGKTHGPQNLQAPK